MANSIVSTALGSDVERTGNQAGMVLGEMAMFIDDFDQHAATFAARSRTKAALIKRDVHAGAAFRQTPRLAEHLVDQRVTDRSERHLVEEIRVR